jgi:DNA invertase Pin-like site-specific DNA recombinase
VHELASMGIRFIAITQNIDTDESNPMSRFMLNIFAAFADNAERAIMQSHGAKVELWPAFG